jgi:hypothetical protein
MTSRRSQVFKPTPIDQLRQPHPDQERIDAESVRLLRITVRPAAEALSWKPGVPAPRPEKKTSP